MQEAIKNSETDENAFLKYCKDYDDFYEVLLKFI